MPDELLIFCIEGNRYAIHLKDVEQVVRAVEIIPLPEGPDIVTGVINVHGQVIPILNVRKKFRLRERAMDLDHNIVIVKGPKWRVAFAVDSVEGVIERKKEEIIPAENILPDMQYTEGVVKIHDDIAFLHDIDRALSFEEQDKLGTVLDKG